MTKKKRYKSNENMIDIDLKDINQDPLCPYCGKTTQQKYRPFCSDRCARLDLGHWLNEGYRVPVIEYDNIDDLENDEPD